MAHEDHHIESCIAHGCSWDQQIILEHIHHSFVKMCMNGTWGLPYWKLYSSWLHLGSAKYYRAYTPFVCQIIIPQRVAIVLTMFIVKRFISILPHPFIHVIIVSATSLYAIEVKFCVLTHQKATSWPSKCFFDSYKNVPHASLEVSTSF